jgi:hypothetical protein
VNPIARGGEVDSRVWRTQRSHKSWLHNRVVPEVVTTLQLTPNKWQSRQANFPPLRTAYFQFLARATTPQRRQQQPSQKVRCVPFAASEKRVEVEPVFH